MSGLGQPVKLPPRPGHDIGPDVTGTPLTSAARCSCSARWTASSEPEAPTLAEWAMVHQHPMQEEAEAAAEGLRSLADVILRSPELAGLFTYSDLNLPTVRIEEYDQLREKLGADHTRTFGNEQSFTEARRRFGPVIACVTIRSEALREAGR